MAIEIVRRGRAPTILNQYFYFDSWNRPRSNRLYLCAGLRDLIFTCESLVSKILSDKKLSRSEKSGSFKPIS